MQLTGIPKDLPPSYSNPSHNFNRGFNRLRRLTPALVSDMGSDPEGYIASKTAASNRRVKILEKITVTLRLYRWAMTGLL